MGWVTKLGPGRCRSLLPELSRFSQIGHIIFRALVGLNTSVPFACRFVACSSRIKVSQTDRHTDEQTKYRNPRCASASRVNKILGCAKLDCRTNYTRLGTKRRNSNSETGIFGFCNQRPDYSKVKSLSGNMNRYIEIRFQLTHTTQLCRDPDGVKP